jgi:hypothetical protein
LSCTGANSDNQEAPMVTIADALNATQRCDETYKVKLTPPDAATAGFSDQVHSEIGKLMRARESRGDASIVAVAYSQGGENGNELSLSYPRDCEHVGDEGRRLRTLLIDSTRTSVGIIMEFELVSKTTRSWERKDEL